MPFKTYVLSCFIVLGSFTVYAQDILVLESETSQPLSGVAIFNASKSKSVVSDIDGKADISKFGANEMLYFQHLSHKIVSFPKSRLIRKGLVVRMVSDAQSLNQVVISASKFEQIQKDVPQKVVSLNASGIQFSNPQTSADLLQNSGQIFIQKSQLGGGSPIIRGFSTNRLMLSVDGVRMNNAIFRGGNLQNVISIDPFSVQTSEIILGAGSVIYGSDAIGGVMNFYTQKPILSYSDSLKITGNALIRHSTANNEKTGHVDFNLGTKKWAFLSSISYTDFDDLKMGKHGPNDFLRPEYVATTNGQDVILQNENDLVQRFTGYNQINLLEKIRYEPTNSLNFNLGLHFSKTSEYPRYDRLIQYNEGILRSAEWNYGPQQWFLGNLQINHKSKTGIYDNAQFTLAYQNFKESRIDRSYQSDLRRTRNEKVDAYSVNFDFEKRISKINELFYGAEFIYNAIGSKATQEDISTLSTENIVTRYPNGSDWQSVATYLSYKYNPTEFFTFQTGLRYNHIMVKADLSENNLLLDLPFNDINLSTGTLTGTAGINWNPNKIIGWRLNFSSAFRAPNIDDVGKVFDSEPGAVVVPNPGLKSERAYGGELGLVLNLNDVISIDLSSYYTFLNNALVRRDFSLNGQTEILYDGELSTVQAIQNASESRIYGFEAGLNINLNKEFKFTTQFNSVGGTEQEIEGDIFPVRHVVPNFGNAHIIWKKSKFKIDLFTNYSGKLSFNELSLSEREKPFLYAVDGNDNPYSPSWYTLNIRTQFNLIDDVSLTATLENITNQRYRTYSSGIAAPGQNLILSLKYNL